MSDTSARLTQEFSLEQLAQRAKSSPANLHAKAKRIVSLHKKSLEPVMIGTTRYLMTVSCGEPAYSIIVPANTSSTEVYVVPVNDVSLRIPLDPFAQLGDPFVSLAGRISSTPDEMLAILNRIESAVKEQKRIDDRERERQWKWLYELKDNAVKFAKEVVEFAYTALPALLLIVFVVSLILLAAYASTGDNRYAEKFDADHPDLVINGTRVDLGEEAMLKGGLDELDPGIPRHAGDIQSRPRAFSVETNSCRHADTVDEIGQVLGGNHLVVQTNAPDDMIRVRVGQDGFVDICAQNPEGRGSYDYLDYIVVAQSVPNAA